MRKVQLDNSDLLAYFNTVEELKNQNHQEILIYLINERILYRKAIEERSNAEIIALVIQIKQRTEADLAFPRSVELSLE